MVFNGKRSNVLYALLLLFRYSYSTMKFFIFFIIFTYAFHIIYSRYYLFSFIIYFIYYFLYIFNISFFSDRNLSPTVCCLKYTQLESYNYYHQLSEYLLLYIKQFHLVISFQIFLLH